MDALGQVLGVTVLVVAAYGLLLHLGLLALTLSAFAEARGYRRRRKFAAYDESFGDPLARSLSVVVAVHDRAGDVVELVQSMTTLRYPDVEVVVVDDGSTDGTAEVLVGAMGLHEVPVLGSGTVAVRGPVDRSWYGRRGTTAVTLLRKQRCGLADAWNAGADVARNPLVVVVDSEAVLDPDALLLLARPFADDPQRVVAATGVVRTLAGSSVRRGRVTSVAMPRSWIGMVQVVSRIETYLVDRAGWSSVGALPRLSATVAVFRRDRLREVGGWRSDLDQPHVELVARLHRWAGDHGVPARIVYVAEPVAWAPAPERRREAVRLVVEDQRAVSTALLAHRGMLGRPRYGAAGLLAYPWLLLFGVLAPVVEAAALAVSLVALTSMSLDALGVAPAVLGAGHLAVLALAWPVAGVLTGWSALVVDEVSINRYEGLGDLARAVWGVVLLQTVWRWLTTLPRLRVSLSVLRHGVGRRGDGRSGEAGAGSAGVDCHTGESAPVHAHRR